jgi:hypothetical protein
MAPRKIGDQEEIELGIYQEEFTLSDENSKIGYRQSGFYHEENIEFITKIGIYELQSSDKFGTHRKFYEPFKTPKQNINYSN